jgi:NAD(P)-dependent dehydrogenase (short-subunit alcohol dehydrogenase family)
VGDATTRTANDAAVAAATDAFGGLDVLVSCVGVFDYYRSIEDLDADVIDTAFDEIFAVNVKSMLHSTKAALPALRESGTGSVVLTESTSAYYAGRGGVLYVGSKFAVRGLVTALAHDLAPEVRVNGVAPGGTLNTDLRGLPSLGMSNRSLGSTHGRAADMAARVPRTWPGATSFWPRTGRAASPARRCIPTPAPASPHPRSDREPRREPDMPKLTADFGACQGYANCVDAAPEVYDIDDDGVVVLIRQEITEEERPRIEEAARSCPVNALTIEES